MTDWFHSIPLPDNGLIQGRCQPKDLMARIEPVMPDFAGKHVLDIGCAEGFYSFLAEERGAASVLAINVDGVELTHLEEAKQRRGSCVEWVQVGVYDATPQLLGWQFDIVLFLGVLYHLLNPMLALERVHGLLRSGGEAVIETDILTNGMYGFTFPDHVPLMRFWPGHERNGDGSNWWTPNRRAMQDMLLTAGLAVKKHATVWGDRGTWLCGKGQPIEVR